MDNPVLGLVWRRTVAVYSNIFMARHKLANRASSTVENEINAMTPFRQYKENSGEIGRTY